MFLLSQNLYVEILNPKVMTLGGAFGLSQEGRGLMNGIGGLIKEAPESSLVPSVR